MTKQLCPVCGSNDTCPILYGYVALDKELIEKLETGEIYLGGCIIDEDNPNRHCNTCDTDF